MKFLQDLLNCAGEGNEYIVVGCILIGLIFIAAWIAK